MEKEYKYYAFISYKREDEKWAESDVDRPLRKASYSPDGQLIASGDRQGKIIIWDAEELAPLREFNAHTMEINSVKFSPDGKHKFYIE